MWSAVWYTVLPLAVLANLEIPNLSTTCWAQPGDVIIAIVTSLTPSTDDTMCISQTSSGLVQKVENMVYAIANLNQNDDILPNVTLGFVVLDACHVFANYLGQVMYLMPSADMISPEDVTTCTSEMQRHYDVIAAIPAIGSPQTIPMAYAMSTAKIPLIGPYQTSNELLDSSKFEYFVRLSLPNIFQAELMLLLIAHYNWTYISMIYSEGPYGEDGVKLIEQGLEQYGLCVENSFFLYDSTYERDIERAFAVLDEGVKSKVIVLFANEAHNDYLVSNMPESLFNAFMWISSDGLSRETEIKPSMDGMFVLYLEDSQSMEFESYYRSLTPATHTENPWFHLLWPNYYDCQWLDNDTAEANITSCSLYENYTVPESSEMFEIQAKFHDAVHVAARGLDGLLRAECPEAFHNRSIIRECLTGETYLEYIYNVSFVGMSGLVEFVKREIQSGYIIKQYHAEGAERVVVGSWSIGMPDVAMIEDAVDWSLTNREGLECVPSSVCSLPCEPRQYIILREETCCWDCLYCRENEIVVGNGTACQECEENTWPDDATATICEDIPPTYLQPSDDIGITLVFFTAVGIALTTATAVLLIYHRTNKLIKASSRELLGIILIGIYLTFCGTIVILLMPTHVTCIVRDVLLSVGTTAMYAPLLLKTIRLYRIFSSGRKGAATVSLISTRAQLAITGLLISIQVCLTILAECFLPSIPCIGMPVLIEKHTELFCSLSPGALAALLTYNLVLLGTCAVFGFLTRKLPENFKETMFILACVSTTSFLWLAFLPTYFTTFYAYHKRVLLATSLLLNAYIVLVVLFIPKLYGVLYVEESKMKFITGTTQVATASNATA